MLDATILDRPHGVRNDMVWIPGGTFRMGSDRHYPEEAPVHRVTVDGFWMDRTPVTNRQFREFVEATGRANGSRNPTLVLAPPHVGDHRVALASAAPSSCSGSNQSAR